MSNRWYETKAGMLDHAWQMLADGAARPDAPARRIVLATVSRDGGATARILALRRADRAAAQLTLYTDLMTEKVSEIAANHRGTILAWIPEDQLQIRAGVRLSIESGPQLEPAWAKLPDAARRNYGGVPAPGRDLADSRTYRETIERARFARIVGELRSFDLVHLGDLHRRAVFVASDGFAGRWVGP